MFRSTERARVMRAARFLSRCAAPERLTIACLRGSVPHAWVVGDPAKVQAAFADLTTFLLRRKVTIFPPQSPFISDSERAVLADLAVMQRQADLPFAPACDSEETALRRCAWLLRDAGLLLPHGASAAQARNRGMAGAVLAGHGDHDLVRARAIALVRARQVASTSEFAAAGVSRQYVSRLCKDGYLQRIRYGWYRAPSRAAAVDQPIQ